MRVCYRVGVVLIVAWWSVGCEILEDERIVSCECTAADDIRAVCEVARTKKDSVLSSP